MTSLLKLETLNIHATDYQMVCGQSSSIGINIDIPIGCWFASSILSFPSIFPRMMNLDKSQFDNLSRWLTTTSLWCLLPWLLNLPLWLSPSVTESCCAPKSAKTRTGWAAASPIGCREKTSSWWLGKPWRSFMSFRTDSDHWLFDQPRFDPGLQCPGEDGSDIYGACVLERSWLGWAWGIIWASTRIKQRDGN